MRYYLFLLVALCSPALLRGQGCTTTLRGYVYDADTDQPLELATVFVEELADGAVTDSLGYFRLPRLCPAAYHLRVDHLGCEPVRFFIELRADTTLVFRLEHHVNALKRVTVSGERDQPTARAVSTLEERRIYARADAGLGALTDAVAGVATLRNGGNIAKPVVHGLYGNRLSILNNGIVQSGQQWGNDHAPEIDPLVASTIRVVKGVAGLAYPGSKLGATVLVEPRPIEREPHLHGRAGYLYSSNGRGHTVYGRLQHYRKEGWAKRLHLGYKKGGDLRTPDYFLNNTGLTQISTALQLERQWGERTFLDLYASGFFTQLGVLRGSHIGNLTDLRNAFSREEPFFTESRFSYGLDPPRQRVHHYLGKAQLRHYLTDERWLSLTVATQYNDRAEFDVRRGGRSNIAALRLYQLTTFAEAKLHDATSGGWHLDAGVQLEAIDNENDPETGILPLIPDYRSYEAGLFALANRRIGRHFVEGGLRYNLLRLRGFDIVRGERGQLSVERFTHLYHNLSLATGWTYALADDYSLALNAGYADRNPAINELYSMGLHQGVSSIEEGDATLRSERAVKLTAGLSANPGDRLTLEALVYWHRIADYIYLAPQPEPRLTIRGSFPVFRYAQTDARLAGLDLTWRYLPLPAWELRGSYSYLHGRDLTNALPLLFIPANTLSGQVRFALPEARHTATTQLALEGRYTFARTLAEGQDFVPPPPGYFLLDARIETEFHLHEGHLNISLRADNLLNTRYRDYLNRLRYFADDLGRNLVLGANWQF